MRHLLAALLGLTIGAALATCTRPAEEPPPDRMATLVAATLTAEPTLPPSPTAPPSPTPILTPSATPTHTPTAGPSPTQTPPALASDDPRYGLDLGSPQYRDDFGSQFTWFGPNFEGAVNIWDDGRMRATDWLADYNIWWSTTIREVDAGNLYVEISAEIDSCAGKDGYGLAVRVSSAARNSGYTLEFSCDGAYRMRTFNAGKVSSLTEWTPAAAIVPGPNAKNRLGLLADGDALSAFANNEWLTTVRVTDFFSGTFGLFSSAEQTPGVTTFFDDFSLWYLTR